MVCQDLLLMDELSDMKLLAGKEGLSRNIRWLYFADSLECTFKEDDPENWVHSGELYVLTNNRMLNDIQSVLKLMKKAYEKEAAGFIINVGNGKKEYTELCNNLAFPLFELPWSIKLVDLSQHICTRLIQETNLESTLEHLLSCIIYTGYESSEDIENKSLYYGIDLRQECRIAVFDIDCFSGYIKSNQLDDEEKINRLKDSFHRTIKFEFKQFGMKKVMSLIQDDSVVVLFPVREIEDHALEEIAVNVQARMKANFPGIIINVGIGNGYRQVEQMKKSFIEAGKAAKLVDVIGNKKRILHFQDTGIYPLLFLINDKTALMKYYNNVLGKLAEYDRMNHSELFDTLEAYIRLNNNTGLAADELFIHRNTLRYRLDKIQSVLETDIEEVENIVNLSIAFRIKKYLDIMK